MNTNQIAGTTKNGSYGCKTMRGLAVGQEEKEFQCRGFRVLESGENQMSLTRKDFRALAAIVERIEVLCLPGAYGKIMKEQIAYDLVDFCAGQNPRFNRSKFLEACGVEE